MSRSLNRLQLIGHIGRDPETRFTTANVSVTSFGLATIYSYKDKGGDWVNQTTWHNAVGFNLPDSVKEQLKKGSRVYLEGRLSQRNYNDREGNKRYVAEVIIEQVINLDNKKSNTYVSDDENKVLETANSFLHSDDAEDLPF